MTVTSSSVETHSTSLASSVHVADAPLGGALHLTSATRHPMRMNAVTAKIAACLAVMMIVGSVGCAKRDAAPSASSDIRMEAAAPAAANAGGEGKPGGGGSTIHASSPGNIVTTPAAGPNADRKVIRNADMTIEVDDPRETARKLGNMSERHGGFLATSDVQQRGGNTDPTAVTVTLVMRIPSVDFVPALEEVRGSAGKVLQERISGQDVTDEFVDLEARLRSYRALENQLHELLRDAKNVNDALQVHTKLNDTRTEIERIEGRKRVLEDKTSLSTITLKVQKVAPLVTASSDGFTGSLRAAAGDSVDTAAAIVTGAIRLTGVLLPVFLLIFLPFGLFLRWMIRLAQRKPKTASA